MLWLCFACNPFHVFGIVAAEQKVAQRTRSQSLWKRQQCYNLGLKVEVLAEIGEDL